MIKLITSTILGVLTLSFFLTSAWSFPDDPAGKVIFKDSKCNTCHTITKQGVTKSGESTEAGGKTVPDLSGVGTKHDAGWISKYLLKKETNTDGDKHLKKFKGTDDQLETLSTWLASLKSK